MFLAIAMSVGRIV